MVLGKYVPELGFLNLLLDNRPPLAGALGVYQRLLLGEELLEPAAVALGVDAGEVLGGAPDPGGAAVDGEARNLDALDIDGSAAAGRLQSGGDANGAFAVEQLGHQPAWLTAGGAL